ncbi:MAG: electron transport complex subunit RsxC [Gammaproteobacteria bacterium]|nr:electron transport complex subunit RsxC [Gammaproteobacteria bacterium]
MKLFSFFGGIKVPSYKESTCDLPSQRAPIPSRLILPLHQHIGSSAEVVVQPGEKVLKGQLIARATEYVSATLHAPTSGTVVSIDDQVVPHPSGMRAPCIVIEPDFQDTWAPRETHGQDFRTMAPSALRNLIREAGIVGLGGAGFPTYVKLNPGPGKLIDTLIINGAECEPYITCDDRLMQERPHDIIEGVKIIRHAVQAKNCIIAIEDNKPQAIAALQQALAEQNISDISIAIVPTRYPAGGEKQLIYTVTGLEVPANGLPLHVGVLCQNVATAAAVYYAVNRGEPLVSRYVTITGDVAQPRNLQVLIGTLVEDLVEFCGGNLRNSQRIIMGGPMMGFALHDSQVPIIKTSNCIIVDAGNVAVLPPRDRTMPCIRCGSCVEVCPVKLLPQQMYWLSKAEEFDKVQNYNLFDCIECGCCDYVCPSNIPLVQVYRFAKGQIWKRERDKQKADQARERHDFRQSRLEREKAEKEAKRLSKAAIDAVKNQTAPAAETPSAPNDGGDVKQAAILAALERAKAKKNQQQYQPRNTDNLTSEQQQAIVEADQRRAKIKAVTDPVNSSENSQE